MSCCVSTWGVLACVCAHVHADVAVAVFGPFYEFCTSMYLYVSFFMPLHQPLQTCSGMQRCLRLEADIDSFKTVIHHLMCMYTVYTVYTCIHLRI